MINQHLHCAKTPTRSSRFSYRRVARPVALSLAAKYIRLSLSTLFKASPPAQYSPGELA
jgi:hypothetical protein